MLTFKCAIEQVADWHPRLFLDSHVVACVAVMSLHSASPGVFEVECENIVSDWLGEETRFALEVSWLAETERESGTFTINSAAKAYSRDGCLGFGV